MTAGRDAPRPIEDSTDPALDPFRAVRDKDLRADGGRFVVEAPRVVSRFLDAVSEGRFEIESIVLDPKIVPSALLERIGDLGTSHCFATSAAIDEASGYLYRLGGEANAMRVYSLEEPTAPAYVGTIGDGYVHDAEVITFSTGRCVG